VLSRGDSLGRRATLEIDRLGDAPLLLLQRGFGSREWFEAACEVAHVRPRVLLESGAPSTLTYCRRAFPGRDLVRRALPPPQPAPASPED
jgi:hypothetical protein